MKVYTEKQKFSNYAFLIRSARELKAGRDINEDDVQYFKFIRHYCKDFKYCNVDVTDPKFRAKAHEAEQMSRCLEVYLDEHKTLNASAYVQLLERINFLFTYLASPEEIAAMIGRLRL